jgi:glycine cleavage system aminomethyltransferase T
MRRILDMARPAGEPEKTHASAAPVDIAPLGPRRFGLRAERHAAREELRRLGREYRPIYGPVEAGLDRFVAYEKEADFVGRQGALEERASGVVRPSTEGAWKPRTGER